MSDRPVRTRIAPSPTGDPHVGTGYIALFNYAFAKQAGGAFLLRIEDTDQSRCSPESEQAIYDALRWLGIDWEEGPDKGGDRGPYRQSERLSIYREHAEMLVEKGHAYRCSCSPERLAELRAQQKAAKTSFGYDGHCRDRAPAEVQAEIDAGAPGVIRLKTPRTGQTIVRDALRDPIEFDNREIDDQVLMKADGFPTYHLANVVDDHLMEISHVIRGEEWITSTPKHVLLYDAFGWDKPVFAHLPLLRNADKSKVSKRKNPVSIGYYREAGFLPDAFLNFLGHMAFTFEDERDVFSLADFVEHFRLDKVALGGPVFDVDKLTWLNGKYLREHRTDADWVSYLRESLFSDEYLAAITPLVKERVDKAEDLVAYAPYFFTPPAPMDPAGLLLKDASKKESVAAWEALTDVVDGLQDFSSESVEAALREFGEAQGLKPKQLFMPVRLMVTGAQATPPLFQTMSVLGRERVRSRLRASIAGLKAYKP